MTSSFISQFFMWVQRMEKMFNLLDCALASIAASLPARCDYRIVRRRSVILVAERIDARLPHNLPGKIPVLFPTALPV